MFKKTLALLAATVTLTVGMGTVALAANCADGAHRWSEVEGSKVAATCTKDGRVDFMCAVDGCTAKKTESIKANGHDLVVEKTVASTCTQAGVETSRCSVCQEVVTKDLPLAAHDFVDSKGKPATCTEPGETAGKVCKVCKLAETKPETIPAKGHTWGEWEQVQAASCTLEGYEVKTCSVCKATEGRFTAKAGHTEKVIAGKEPTCTEKGKTDKIVCTVCGATVSESKELPALGHVEEIIPPVAATCTTSAKTAGTKCAVCEETIKAPGTDWGTNEGKPLGHDLKVTAVVKKATCQEEGRAYATCSRCGKVEYIALGVDAENGHHIVVTDEKAATCKNEGFVITDCDICWKKWTKTTTKQLEHLYQAKVYQKQSCTQDGITVFECAYCGELEKESEGSQYAHKVIAPAINHKRAIEQKPIEPTCTTAGTYGYKYCPDCGMYWNKSATGDYAATSEYKDKTANVRAAKGHLFDTTQGSKFKDVAPTCISGGKRLVYCAHGCGMTEVYPWQDSKPDTKNGHKYEKVAAKAATCTEAGWKEYEKCSLCDKPNGKVPTIDALGHDWATDAGKAPTCTEAGVSEAHKCTRCNVKVGGQTIPADGHKYVVDEKLSTEAITVEICSVCKDIKYTEHEVECKHNWVTIKGTPATCTTAGKANSQKCTICGEVLGGETLPATGHTKVVVKKAVEATCYAAGNTEGWQCANCDYAVVSEKLPRLEHKPYYVPAVAPTCTKDGHSALYACEYCQAALTEYDVYMSNGEHTPVYGYNSDVHYMACKTCGEILLSGAHELVTTVSGGKVHTACKWCAYSKESSIFGK